MVESTFIPKIEAACRKKEGLMNKPKKPLSHPVKSLMTLSEKNESSMV